MKNLILTTSLLFWITTSYAENNTKIVVGDFSNSDLTHWEEKQFSGKTTYQLVKLEQKTVLKAISKGTASGLFKKQTIDLKKTPYLNWSWRIQQQLGKLNEKS